MSTVGGPQSTPGSHRVASKSQAGDQGFKQKEIKEEVELDLQNAVKCRSDQFVKYCLYLTLKEDSDEKKKLEELQAQIEELQSKRYYKQESGGNGAGETEDNASGDLITGSGIHEKARQEEVDDDYENGEPHERELVREREVVLDKLLRDALIAILYIANDAEVRGLLNNFADGFSGDEKNRYGPHVILCNHLLDLLKTAARHLPIRGPDPLDIRFQRNDPAHIISNFHGTDVEVKRDPDVIISSFAALFHLNGQTFPKYSERPPKFSLLTWPFVLSSVEYKVHNANYPEHVKSIPPSHVFKVEDTPVLEEDHTELPRFDETKEGVGTEDDPQSATGSKRSLDAAGLGVSEGQSSTKKSRTPTGTLSGSKAKFATSAPVEEVTVNRQTQKAIHGRVQCASYALEMLSYSAGVHHAINLLFTDGIMWIWYYDRQGVIQSTGIGVFNDFPRFIVLLLALQRFTPENWGIIRALNPEAMHEHGKPTPTEEEKRRQQQQANKKRQVKKQTAPEGPVPPVVIDLKEDLEHVKDFTEFWKKKGDDGVVKLSEVELNMKEFLSNQPHCLAGRATAVVPAVGRGENGTGEMKMVCKVYHPEVQRRHEGLTMQVIYNTVEDDRLKVQQDPEGVNAAKLDMFKHLPKFYFHGDVKDTTTQRVRSMVNRNWKGHRTMRIVGMKQLHKITTISGWEFVKAWLEGVTCHAFLWKNFIEHGDPSASNLMYDPDTKSGVLTDFDLSLLQWEPRVFGTDRTGTVPFMALDLLTKEYWDGKIKRYYHHELESFIWILPYVFLLYQDGKRRQNPLIDSWRTSAYTACAKEKVNFYSRELRRAAGMVQADFNDCWWLAGDLCEVLHDQHNDIQKRLNAAARGGVNLKESKLDYIRDSKNIWGRFQEQLTVNLAGINPPDFTTLLDCFKYYKPGFVLSKDHARYLRQKYSAILGHVLPK